MKRGKYKQANIKIQRYKRSAYVFYGDKIRNKIFSCYLRVWEKVFVFENTSNMRNCIKQGTPKMFYFELDFFFFFFLKMKRIHSIFSKYCSCFLVYFPAQLLYFLYLIKSFFFSSFKKIINSRWKHFIRNWTAS